MRKKTELPLDVLLQKFVDLHGLPLYFIGFIDHRGKLHINGIGRTSNHANDAVNLQQAHEGYIG